MQTAQSLWARIGDRVRDLSRYMRPGEYLTRTAGVSRRSIAVQAAVFAAMVLAYWIGMQVFIGVAPESPINQAMEGFVRLVISAMTGLLAIAALFGIIKLSVRAVFLRYGLTESRVLKRSFLRVRGAELVHVQDVEVVQSFLGRLMGFGDVVVRTASTDGTIVLRNVDSPHDWFSLVHEAIRQRQMNAGRSAEQ